MGGEGQKKPREMGCEGVNWFILFRIWTSSGLLWPW